MSGFDNILLTVKYQPETLEDLIIPDRIKTRFKDGVDNHYLLHGAPGVGKTTLAKILASEFNMPMLYINASDETSVDVLRSKITDFCSTASLIDGTNKMKLVVLDEIEGVSDQFFKALRGTMDKFTVNSRFIATTNYINKIPEPIRSRFSGGLINFDFDKEESDLLLKDYMRRIYNICKNEGVEIEKKALLELVKRKFPDLRSIINILQGYISEGYTTITVNDIKKFHGIYKDVYELIFSKASSIDNYKHIVSEYQSKVDDVLQSLGEDFIDFIEMEHPEKLNSIPEIIIEVATHQSQRVTVIDPVITLLSLVYRIQGIIHK